MNARVVVLTDSLEGKDSAGCYHLHERYALSRVVDLLNKGVCRHDRLDASQRAELRELVDDWLTAEMDWRTFITMRLQAQKSVKFTSGEFYLPPDSCRPVLVPSPARGSSHAEGVFLQYVLNPEHWRLCGPCACGCGGYFLKERDRKDTRYIKGHAQAETSRKRQREVQAEKRAPRLRAVKGAIARYQRESLSPDWLSVDWKDYVWDAAHVTPNTLTRWAEQGFFEPPAIQQSTKPQAKKQNRITR